MRQVIIRGGVAVAEEVPEPLVEPGTVLVRSSFSCISVGTEMAGIRTSALPLWKRALQQPENAKRVLQMASQQGWKWAWTTVRSKLEAGNATGYSVAGTVVAVGEGISDLAPGDRVACAGAQCAHHAETVRIPRNLCVPLPENLDLESACTVTLGAIALQGVRRANPTLGEAFVVIGMGILGQLTAQLLKANGCRVIATDLDASRLKLGQSMGVDTIVNPDGGDPFQQVANLTAGIGADGVIITAAGSSDEIISSAFRFCRKKGRVVLVGDVGLHLNRSDFYEKEIDFLISSSYGPGRYDRNYEERGLDYPAPFVRWTENRNMLAYLSLLAQGKVNVRPLISAIFPIEEAPEAYRQLREDPARHVMVLISYKSSQNEKTTSPHTLFLNPRRSSGGEGTIRLALIGAGSFAQGMHLPNLRRMPDKYTLHAVASRTGHAATVVGKAHQCRYATTDPEEIYRDPDVEAVLITTRHDSHARLAIQALKAGKHVLLEKPLALTASELQEISTFYENAGEGAPILLTGFNRRFSSHMQRAGELSVRRTSPLICNYRMNAGFIPLNHWVHGPEGGGRNLGEACHIYDLFVFLTRARPVTVHASAIRPQSSAFQSSDNFVATVGFHDGSVCTLTYTAMGSKDYPKETMELYTDGAVAHLEDYRELAIKGSRLKSVQTKSTDKGHSNELVRFAEAIRKGGEWPIPLWEQLAASQIALDVEQFLILQAKHEDN